MGESIENVDDEIIAAASGWARGTSLEFAGNALTVAIPAEEPRSAEDEGVSVHQNKVRLAVVQPGQKREELRLILDDGRSMRRMLDEKRAVAMPGP